jgi:hypothetical protein
MACGIAPTTMGTIEISFLCYPVSATNLSDDHTIYPSKIFRTYGRCISMLCSASSALMVRSSNLPVSRSSLIAEPGSIGKITVVQANVLARSNGNFPMGVWYSLHEEIAHPSKYMWCEGPRMKTRLLGICNIQSMRQRKKRLCVHCSSINTLVRPCSCRSRISVPSVSDQTIKCLGKP